MRRIDVSQLDIDLTPAAGLARVDHYLKALDPAWRRLDCTLPVRTGMTRSGILRTYLDLLVQGESYFDAVEGFCGEAFFKQALGIGVVQPSPTLRQRLDTNAGEMFERPPPMIESLLACRRPDFGLLPCGWLRRAARSLRTRPAASTRGPWFGVTDSGLVN